jgi:uncharacterized membrane protein YfcA
MSFGQAAFLLIAGLLAGALNSVAGGGGFIAFPAMLFAGIAPIEANASQTIALWPGGVASIGAYRREYVGGNQRVLLPLFLITFIGSLAGAYLLLHTPQAMFVRLIPWLLLVATILFAFGGKVVAMIRRRVQAAAEAPHVDHDDPPISKLALVGGTVVQFVFAIYIGYFGAGAGILILSLLTMMGLEKIHTMNAFKVILVAIGNGVALVTFVVAHKVEWTAAMTMMLGAIIGGYAGAWYAQKLNPKHVRYFVICVGASMTIYFFLKH